MALEFGNQSKSYLSRSLRAQLNGFKAIGYQKLTVAGSVVSLTVPTDTKYAEIRLESDVTSQVAVRYLLLGTKTVPTSTDGMALNHLDIFDITDAQNINNFRAIQATAGTHTLHIQYYA